jgi:acyl carrier protein
MLSTGIKMISPKEGREIFSELLKQDLSQIAVLPIDWSIFSKFGKLSNMFELVMPSQTTISKVSWRQQLIETPIENRFLLLTEHVQEQVADVLGWPEKQGLDTRQVFSDLGMDSLMVVTLRNRLQSSLELKLPSTLAFDYPTVEDLCHYLAQSLQISASYLSSNINEEESIPLEATDDLSKDELRDMLDQELEMLTDYWED